MAGGFGVPALDFAGALGGIASNLTKQSERQRRLDTLSQLGPKLRSGDYAGASQMAFDAGDADTGLALLKLGETRRQGFLGEQASRDFVNSLSGGYGGDAGGGAPSIGPRADRSTPSFAEAGAPSSDYVASLFKRESGGDPNAQASTSSARGLGQFTTGTWNRLAGQRPDLGLTPVGSGRDGRTDVGQMTRATEALTAGNADALRRSNLPVNDASLYSLHFLGEGGGRRFVAGTLANPDRPAASIVGPDQVRANKNVFYHRDGRAKTAGEVMGDFQRSFGGGRVAAAPGARPAAPRVDVAENEADVQRLERRLGMMPADALAYDPRADMPAEGAVPTIAQAPSGFGVPPLQVGFQRPLPSSDPNARNVPPSPVQGGGLTGAPQSVSARDVPPSANSDAWRDGAAPAGRMSPDALVPTLGGPVPDRAMQLPPEAGGPPTRVAQAGGTPDLSTPAGRQAEAATRQLQGIGASGLGSQQRIQAISRAIANPYLPDGPRELAKTMLQEELQRTRLPENVKTFLYYRGAGLTQAQTPAEFEREMKGPSTLAPGSSLVGADGRIITTAPDRERDNKVAADIEARKAGAADLGLRPGSPAYQSYVLTGKMPREDQQPLTASDKKAILEADDGVASAETAISNLTQAKQVSKGALSGYFAAQRGNLAAQFGGQAGLDTVELDNLVTTNALGQLKSIFGAAPTEGERKILLDIQGSSSLPHAAREKIYDRATELANRRLEMSRQRAAELRGQTYYKPDGGSPEARSSSGASRALPAPSPSNRPGAATAADRFGELTASGLSKEQAYQRLQSEGY